MGLYSEGLSIGRKLTSEIRGAYFREGLFFGGAYYQNFTVYLACSMWSAGMCYITLHPVFSIRVNISRHNLLSLFDRLFALTTHLPQ